MSNRVNGVAGESARSGASSMSSLGSTRHGRSAVTRLYFQLEPGAQSFPLDSLLTLANSFPSELTPGWVSLIGSVAYSAAQTLKARNEPNPRYPHDEQQAERASRIHQLAIDSWQRLLDWEPGDADLTTRQALLVHHHNHVEYLQAADDVLEAERALNAFRRRIVQWLGRESIWFGRAAIQSAALAIARRQDLDALPHLDQAINILQPHKDTSLGRALTWKAIAMRRLRKPIDPLAVCDTLTAATLDALVVQLLLFDDKGRRRDAKIKASLLFQLLSTTRQRLGRYHERVVDILQAVADLAGRLQRPEHQIRALQSLINTADARGEIELSARAMLQLAETLADSEMAEAARSALEVAVDRARETANPLLHGIALFEYGSLLQHSGDAHQAESAYSEAIRELARTPERERTSISQIQLGVIYLHRGELDRGGRILKQGLQGLDRWHPTRLIGELHMAAKKRKSVCCCLDPDPESRLRLLERFVNDHLPGRFVKRLAFRLSPAGELDVQVELAEDPSSEEQAILNQLLEFASSQLDHESGWDRDDRAGHGLSRECDA